jgi:hypothetical protein
MTARIEVTAAPVVREQAFEATLENAKGVLYDTKNEQITRRERQRRGKSESERGKKHRTKPN